MEKEVEHGAGDIVIVWDGKVAAMEEGLASLQ